jgi:hypothetical protein
MCPDPWNMTIDMIFIAFAIAFLAHLPLLAIWLFVGIMCYFFAPRHSVFCGIPLWHPSRYEAYQQEPHP